MRIDRHAARAAAQAERERRRRKVQDCFCGSLGPDGEPVRMAFHYANEGEDGTLTFTRWEGEDTPAPVPVRCGCGHGRLVYGIADRRGPNGQALPPPPDRELTVTVHGELRFRPASEIPADYVPAYYRGWPVLMDAEAIAHTPGARHPTLAESAGWITTLLRRSG